jgi:hypothetical protein
LSSLRKMIHSASFLATGSDIAAAVCVASAGLCLRTSSMTFSSASVSACEVDDVAATAAGGGLRAGAGGNAACWRAAGAKAGAGVAAGAIFLAAAFTAGAWVGAGVAAGAIFLAAVLVAGAVFLVETLGTTLRAIGRGFGSGTVGVAQASAANTDNPTASAKLVANAVDRNAAARNDGVTAFLRGESLNRSSPGCISLNMWTKY